VGLRHAERFAMNQQTIMETKEKKTLGDRSLQGIIGEEAFELPLSHYYIVELKKAYAQHREFFSKHKV
jgi:hypothetical protein